MRRFNGKRVLMVVVALSIVLGFSLLINTKTVSAAGADAAQFNADTSMMENLLALKGKTVTVYLMSGQPITGVVNNVKGNLLHLGKLSQKEFYDALIAIDRISAIEARAR